MASILQSSSLLYSSSPSSCSSSISSRRINAAIHVPNLKKVRFSIPKLPTKNFADELSIIDRFTTFPAQDQTKVVTTTTRTTNEPSTNSATAELYMILEAVADRVEMHKNICEQRNNWNTLLLNSINMITLTAATMTGVAVATSGDAGTSSILALKLSSTLLFSAATGILAVMNKIQPSQLVEEQRSVTRLFSQLQSEIKTILALRSPTQKDVKVMMRKVLALDKAYPLPLIGTMLEKFPQTFEPACWWPKNDHQFQETSVSHEEKNGWSESLEREMREILEVIKTKDMEDYERLGNIALKVNKVLAISGPLLTGIAAVASPFVGSSSNIGSCAAIISVVAGSLASVVNTFEHGGQVGMVVEMYRNCAGFFQLLEDSIESTLEEPEVEKRENGEMFEMKVALKLGRSLSQLRDLAKNSENSRRDGSTIDEFASKLF